ncbi:MAG: helix-turn-helix transcriptional regulator [Clostridia bacterium]|nr:helix-turn-helix transcriptional regulator [Clostridia bacterium]
MDFLYYGTNYKNEKGEFCQRVIIKHYFISYFRTDYLYECDGELLRGRAGDMYIAPPGSTIYHGPTPEAKGGFSNDWMYFLDDGLEAFFKKYPLPMCTPFAGVNPSLLATAIGRIDKEWSEMRSGYVDKCASILTELFIDVFRAVEGRTVIGAQRTLEEVRREIMRNYKRAWSLSELATMSGYSPSRFSALYKKEYGISPINDLIGRRIDEAKLLILYGNMSLAQVAEETGFSSIYYFSKYFKRREGISPAAFRKESYKNQ